jgi:multidrug efflux pump subunit AcrB
VSFYSRLITNHPLANITFGLVLILGLLAYGTMPREQDPEINFNWVNIATVLPGASPADTERLVTQPLEDAIKSVADVRFVMSSSRENVSSILVRFREIDERQFDKRINDLRREIQNKAKAELPPEAKEPEVTEITTSNGFPTAMVLVTGQADDASLRERARLLKNDLERLAGVDRVIATGLRDPELEIRFDPRASAARGLSGADVADSVNAWFRDTFAGKIDNQNTLDGNAAWLVRVIGQQADADYLARLSVASSQTQRGNVPLGDIASVSQSRARPSTLASQGGQPAVLLAITKKSGINTLQLVERVDGFLAGRNETLAGTGIRAELLDDQTPTTRNAINIMQANAIQGLLLVLLICWLFLGTRVALLVSVGIPFSLAGTFFILDSLDHTLNISVLLGVVIALGMIVDDAVVVVEAIYFRMQRGTPVLEAVNASIREVFAPVTASVATTLAAFLPLMLLPGIVGKFMFVIPFVVTLALLISLIEAYWMLPSHITAVNPHFDRPSRMQQWRTRFLHAVRLRYSRWLIKVMRRPRFSAIVMGLTVTLSAGAVATGLVRTQFFAFDPMPIFYINVDLPAGAAIDQSLNEAQRVEAKARQYLQPGEARGVASYAGLKFTDTEPLYGEAYGQVIVSLNPRSSGTRSIEEIVASMRADLEGMTGPGKVTFTLISGGPPLAKPVKVRVRGDDPVELRAAADALLAIVQGIEGIRDVADDDIVGRPELKLTLDREAVRAAGLNPATVARLLRLQVDGEIVAILRDKGEKIEVRVRAQHQGPDGRQVEGDIIRLLDAPIPLPGGGTTLLRSLVEAQTETGPGVIKHYNLRRAITVEADLDKDKLDTVAANQLIREAWKAEASRFPGTDIDFSGELDDIQESLDAMLVLFLMGIGLIYLILAAQFRSYWQPLLILSTVPMAFTGVIFGLLISNNPLSLYSMYGVIALTGIAVNSAIVLIDAANSRLADGMSVLHAAIYAARRRVVPILITTFTTIGGLISLALGLGGKSLIWGPVAGAIVWGLGVSTVLTLFVVPLLYRTFMRGNAGVRAV